MPNEQTEWHKGRDRDRENVMCETAYLAKEIEIKWMWHLTKCEWILRNTMCFLSMYGHRVTQTAKERNEPIECVKVQREVAQSNFSSFDLVKFFVVVVVRLCWFVPKPMSVTAIKQSTHTHRTKKNK